MRTLEIRRCAKGRQIPISFPQKGQFESWLSQRDIDFARTLGSTIGRFNHVIADGNSHGLETAIAMGYAVDQIIHGSGWFIDSYIPTFTFGEYVHGLTEVETDD